VLSDQISFVEQMLGTLDSIQPSSGVSKVKISDRFLRSTVELALERQEAFEDLQKKKNMVKIAFKIVEEHSTYLEGQLNYYRTYLENVRKGKAHEVGNSKEYDQVYTVSHSKLEDMKVIEWVEPGFAKTLKKCMYKFTHIGPNAFRVQAYLKKAKFHEVSQELKLDDLLQMKDNLQTSLEMGGYVRLNVNLLVHLLNREFICNT